MDPTPSTRSHVRLLLKLPLNLLRTTGKSLGTYAWNLIRTATRLALFLALVAGVVFLLSRSRSVRNQVSRQMERASASFHKMLSRVVNNEVGLDRVEQLAQNLERVNKTLKTTTVAGTFVNENDLQGGPVEVRPLPYPFFSYLTINSDPDSMTVKDYLTIHPLVHEDYQLNIGDQVFVACPRGSQDATSLLHLKVEGDKATPADWERFHRFLVMYNRGWIDGVHGWHSLAIASPESAFDLRMPERDEYVTKTIAVDWKDYDAEDVSYLLFEYRMPTPGSSCTLDAGDKPLSVQILNDRARGMENALTWTPVYVSLPPKAGKEFSFHLKGKGAVLNVRNLVLANFCRARAMAEADLLERYNVGFLMYTEHGRRRHEFSLGTRSNLENTTRYQFLGDNPVDAPNAYFMDSTDRLGVAFITAMHHCSQPKALPIQNAIHAHRFNDGIVRYNLFRFSVSPKKDGSDWAPKSNTQAERWLGFQLKKLRLASMQFGEGGDVYTHWGCDNPKDAGLSQSTRAELKELQDAYYDLSGQKKVWERIWVAPTSEICLLARALQGIHDNAVYDDVNNIVRIRSWLDPVSRQVIPARGAPGYGLANVTFYVGNSADARVLIDGKPFTCFARNPADHTGRESITLVDDSCPVTVFDEVDPLQRFAEVFKENADSYFRSTGGFTGPHCLEMQLSEETGSVTWTFPSVTSANTTHFRFAYRKENPDAEVAVRIVFQNGDELFASEGAMGDTPGWSIAGRHDGKWHDVVLSLASISRSKPAGRVPSGPVTSIRFEARGATAGDRFFLDRVQFLRNNIHPLRPDGKVLIAGTTTPPADDVTVVLEDGKHKHTTKTVKGCFFFPERVRRGAVVKVYALPEDGAARYSNMGRLFEVNRNEVELSINLNDARDLNKNKKLLRKTQMYNEQHQDAGQIYRPGSLYETGGIGAVHEFQNQIQVSNLGFLDRDRRFANPDGARRILFLGNCNLFGHSVPQAYHSNVVLEGLLSARFGYPIEVPCLANSGVNFGRYWLYYQAFGKKLKPEIVCIFIQSSEEILECDPEALAEYREYDIDHLPYCMFRTDDNNQLRPITPDPEFYRFVGKDGELRQRRERDRNQGNYVMDGVDWMTVYHRADDEAIPPRARKLWEHFERVTRLYRDEFRKHGSRLMLVLTPEVQLRYLGNTHEWRDFQGKRCRLERFPDRLARMCADLNIGFVDSARFNRTKYPDPAMCSWRHDNHPSAYGFEWMAEAVADYLVRTQFLHDLPRGDPLELEDFALGGY